jgi:electron transport complex protein RnfD
MRRVLYALLPGVITLFWSFGWGVLIQIAMASASALLAEAIMLNLRGRALRPFLTDGSAVVTAWLLAVSLPPLAPWWLSATGTGFAIVIAKHLYGGLGYNPFNPAMVGYAVLLISFPLEMTSWPLPQLLSDSQPDLTTTATIIFAGIPAPAAAIDALTGATVLDVIKTRLGQGQSLADITATPLFGYIAGSGREWSSMAFAAGGLWLLISGTADWRIPLTMLLSLLTLATVFHVSAPFYYASPVFHLVAGATLLGAFFIATDPVSASTTPRGRLIYGAGIGCLTYLIRVFGGYPDGLAFAVLLMNLAAPSIDYFTRPRVFGRPR